ncbi:hypothetical protein CYMTET_29899, partial [Cymbomonas tetramitiformis]
MSIQAAVACHTLPGETGDTRVAVLIGLAFHAAVVAGSGGALAVLNDEREACRISLDNSVFVRNVAAVTGGAVHTADPTDLVLLGVRFEGNTAGVGGGAISVEKTESMVIIAHCHLLANTAESGDGGAIVAGDLTMVTATSAVINTLAIQETMIESNQSPLGYGGGLAVDSAVFNLTQCRVEENRAINGGGIFLKDSWGVISENTFAENRARWHGGGMNAYNTTLRLAGSNFTGNGADYGGAAVLYYYCHLDLARGFFSSNSATTGGAFYLDPTTSLAVATSVFAWNTASTDGGAVFCRGSSVRSTSTNFSHNAAGSS